MTVFHASVFTISCLFNLSVGPVTGVVYTGFLRINTALLNPFVCEKCSSYSISLTRLFEVYPDASFVEKIFLSAVKLTSVSNSLY